MAYITMRTAVEIDSDKLGLILFKQGKPLSELSKQIGAGACYFSRVLSEGRMSYSFVRRVCAVFNVSEADFVKDSEVIEAFNKPAVEEKDIDDLLLEIAEAIAQYLKAKGGK